MSATAHTRTADDFDANVERAVERALLRNIPGLNLPQTESDLDVGPTEKELTASKQNITGGFPLKIASNSKIVEYIAMLGFYDLPLDYLDTLVDKVNAVTREQIREAFQRRVHPDRMVTVVVGNGDQGGK